MILPGEVVCHPQHFLAVTLPIIATGLCHATVNWLILACRTIRPPQLGERNTPWPIDAAGRCLLYNSFMVVILA